MTQLLAGLLACLLGTPASATSTAASARTAASAPSPAVGGMIPVGPGVYQPIFPVSADTSTVAVARFSLDRRPVTVAEFAAFVATHRAWTRDAAPQFLADASYLRSWAANDAPGDARAADEPVTEVSFFAARAYCAARGARLPTEAEWEIAAAAGDRGPDGRREPGFTQRILDGYGRPATDHRSVGLGRPNFWGVHDIHGLIWEWTSDFNRASSANDRDTQARFCGGSALGSAQRDDYPAFMRAALRSSLVGNSTVSGLGFRCARDLRGRKGGR